jgi:hypothetical protein
MEHLMNVSASRILTPARIVALRIVTLIGSLAYPRFAPGLQTDRDVVVVVPQAKQHVS